MDCSFIRCWNTMAWNLASCAKYTIKIYSNLNYDVKQVFHSVKLNKIRKNMHGIRFRQCEGYFRPDQRRLSCFPIQSRDDDECYTESLKCFLGLCDQQKNVSNSFKVTPNNEVVTNQPKLKRLTCTQSNSMVKY